MVHRQEEITEATRNMCLVSLVKNPYLQVENKHRKLLFRRHSGDELASLDSETS